MIKSLNQILQETEEALLIMKHHCIGCTRLVTQGCVSYAETIPQKDGVCPQCGKKRYQKV